MKKNIVVIGLVMQFLLSSMVNAADEGFPGRAEYPEVKIYYKDMLFKSLDEVIVVDARSSLEYETLSIKGAINIPVASKSFGDRVKALRNTTSKPIVFYCNGRSCFKSYKASEEAARLNIKNTFAYDAGVFEWAKTYPEQAVLLGKSPIDPNNIISKTRFSSRLLEPENFAIKANAFARSKSLVLDVRDMYQRAGAGFFPGRERWVSLDDQKKLQTYLTRANKENKTLFIYDETGKQVRWLQYALEKANIKNYYFMKNGAKGFYKEVINKPS